MTGGKRREGVASILRLSLFNPALERAKAQAVASIAQMPAYEPGEVLDRQNPRVFTQITLIVF